MKLWVLVPIVLLMSGTTAVAKPKVEKTTALLTQQQFSRLTYTEQLSYVKKVREIFVEMGETSPGLVAEFAKRGGLFAAMMDASLPMAIAQEAAKPETSTFDTWNPPMSTDDSRAKMFLEVARQYVDTVRKTKNEKELTEEQKSTLRKNFEDGYKMIKMSTFVKQAGVISPVGQQIMQEEISRLNAVQKENEKIVSAAVPKGFTPEKWKKSVINLGSSRDKPVQLSADELGTLVISAPHPEYPIVGKVKAAASTNVSTDEKLTPVKDSPDKTKTEPTTPAKPETAAASDREGDSYRCMYAGFMVKGRDCKAPREIPWKLEGLPSPFACEAGKVMCNPLIFGAKVTCDWSKDALNNESGANACMSTATPYCVRTQAWATKECDSMSSSKDKFGIETAVYLNSRVANKKIIDDFNNSFEDLCDHGRIDYKGAKSKSAAKKDIKLTCDKARGRFQEIKAKYNVQETPTEKRPIETDLQRARR